MKLENGEREEEEDGWKGITFCAIPPWKAEETSLQSICKQRYTQEWHNYWTAAAAAVPLISGDFRSDVLGVPDPALID